MPAPKQFSQTAQTVYDYVASLGLADPREIIEATVRAYAGQYGFEDQEAVATLVDLITRVAEWESGLQNIKAKSPGEESYGLFQNNIEGGRGTGYTAAEMLDPIANSILATEELLPLGQQALTVGGVPEAARALVVQGQRPAPSGNVQGMINFVAGQDVPTPTVTAQQTGGLDYGGVLGGGGTTEGTIPGMEETDAGGNTVWTEQAIIAYTSAGLSDADAEDAVMLWQNGILPATTWQDAFQQYGQLLKAADAAGVPVGELWQMLTAPAAEGTPDLLARHGAPPSSTAEGTKAESVRNLLARHGAPPSSDRFEAILADLGLRGLQVAAEQLGLTAPELQTALRLNLTEDDIAVARSQGWSLDRTAQLRDQVTAKGMTLSQSTQNGYLSQVLERERLAAVGGGDIQAGLDLENRLIKPGETVQDYTRRRILQGASPDEIQRSITAQRGQEAYREMLWARPPTIGSSRQDTGKRSAASLTSPGGPLQASGYAWAGQPGGMLGLTEEGAMLTGQRLGKTMLGANRPLGTQTQAEATARRQAIIAANPQIARREGLLPERPPVVAPPVAAATVKPPAKGAIPGEGRLGKLPPGQRPPPGTTARVPAGLLPPPPAPVPPPALPLTMGTLAAGLKKGYKKRKKTSLLPAAGGTRGAVA